MLRDRCQSFFLYSTTHGHIYYLLCYYESGVDVQIEDEDKITYFSANIANASLRESQIGRINAASADGLEDISTTVIKANSSGFFF